MSVDCELNTNYICAVNTIDGVLTIEVKDGRKWYQRFFSTGGKITVRVPVGDYYNLDIACTTGDITVKGGYTLDDVKIKTTTGDISLDGIRSNGDADIKVTTGDVIINNLICNNLSVNGSTSDISLNNVLTYGNIYVNATTGDLVFNASDAKEIYVDLTTGDVSGSLLSAKVFQASTTTGSIRLPDTNTGGLCKIKTTTGDINITIP